MKKNALASLIVLLFSFFLNAQQNNKSINIKLNSLKNDLVISRDQVQSFDFKLKKDTYYSILTMQKGIDLIVTLKDEKGKVLETKDSPNGLFGPEKIIIYPKNSGSYSISVQAVEEKTNSQSGKYSVLISKIDTNLKRLNVKQMTEDLNILQNAYYETRVGLWYNSRIQFDSICSLQKSKIKNNMTSLEFYRILAPLATFTKEGHNNIKISEDANFYLRTNGNYLPFYVKIINKKIYVLNDIGNLKTKGYIISKIDGKSSEEILKEFLGIEPADGFNTTSKYHWIEEDFSRYYARYFDPAKFFSIELINPQDNSKTVYDKIAADNYQDYNKLLDKITETIPNYKFKEASTFSLDNKTSTATITVNSFSLDSYKEGRKGFQDFLENTFNTISKQKIKHLIIDIRRNEGGEQGMEDELLSHLISMDYLKYKYVEIPAITYSFLKYTDYKDEKDILMKELKEDFSQNKDGRFLNMKGHYEGLEPKGNNFKGDIYILISGLTFSGGSEFASLAKNYTNAKFIGEETGGGYYGNSSGSFLKFTLPNSQITGRIPLCKFVIVDKDFGIPFGHGVLSDYNVQSTIDEYFKGFDPEMKYAMKLISK